MIVATHAPRLTGKIYVQTYTLEDRRVATRGGRDCSGVASSKMNDGRRGSGRTRHTSPWLGRDCSGVATSAMMDGEPGGVGHSSASSVADTL